MEFQRKNIKKQKSEILYGYLSSLFSVHNDIPLFQVFTGQSEGFRRRKQGLLVAVLVAGAVSEARSQSEV